MCQLKSTGKRCPIHLLGSRALIKTTAIEAGVSVQEARAAFTALRKEGKRLNPPTADEVRAFAEAQRFRAKINPNLSKYESTVAQRQWDRAKEENPDGGTFHAWRNTLKEMKRKTGTKILAVGVTAGLSVALAACSGASGPGMEAPTNSPTPTPTATQSYDYSLDYSANSAWKVTAGEKLSDQFGEFSAMSIDPDSPAFKFKDDVVDKDVYKHFSRDEVQEAVVESGTFLVETVADNELTFTADAGDREAFYEHTKDRVHKEYAPYWKETILAGEGEGGTEANNSLVANYAGVPMAAYGMRPTSESYSADHPRVTLGDMKVVKVEMAKFYEGDDSLNVTFDYNVDMSSWSQGEQTYYIHTVGGSYRTRLTPEDEKWAVTGTGVKYSIINVDTIPVDENNPAQTD